MDAKRFVYIMSLGLHVVGGAALGAIERPPVKEVEVIEMTTVELPKPPKPPPPPDPPPEVEQEPEAPTPPPPAQAPAAPAEPAAPTAAPDFGLMLGAADGPGGIAVGPATPKAANNAPARQEVRKLVPTKVEPPEGCTGENTKPKALSMPRPAYTDEARAAGVEGKVRVELTVEPSGAVAGVRVLEGLGHGLDEAAIEAVKGASFNPATSCGKPVAATFTVAIRFAL